MLYLHWVYILYIYLGMYCVYIYIGCVSAHQRLTIIKTFAVLWQFVFSFQQIPLLVEFQVEVSFEAVLKRPLKLL